VSKKERDRTRTTRQDAADYIDQTMDSDLYLGDRRHRWQSMNHVLTVRCSHCGLPAFILLAQRDLTTADEIVAKGYLGQAGELVRETCRCYWHESPGLDSLRRDVARAIRKGLGRATEHTASTAYARPDETPDDDYYVTPHGHWRRRSAANDPCPVCGAPNGHPVPTDPGT